jgi:hypothetical protein
MTEWKHDSWIPEGSFLFFLFYFSDDVIPIMRPALIRDAMYILRVLTFLPLPKRYRHSYRAIFLDPTIRLSYVHSVYGIKLE